jgi:hypothetical protein
MSEAPATPNTRRRRQIEERIEAQSRELASAIAVSVRARLRGGPRKHHDALMEALQHLGVDAFAEFMSVGDELASADENASFDDAVASTFLDKLTELATNNAPAGVTDEDKTLLADQSADTVKALRRLAEGYRAKEEEFRKRCEECASSVVPHAAPGAPPGTPAPGSDGGGAPPPPAPSAPTSVAKRVSALLEMAKLQNGGDALPSNMRASARTIVAVINAVEKEGCLPDLKELCPRLKEALEAQQEPARWVVLDEFSEAVRAVALAFCDVIGTGYLAAVVPCERDKCAAAKDGKGDPLYVGAKINDVLALAEHVRRLCCPPNEAGASYYQARRLCENAWGALDAGLEGLTVSATLAACAAREALSALPPDKKSEKKKPGGGHPNKAPKRPVADYSSSSSSEDTPAKKKPRRAKAHKKKRKRASRESASSSDSSDSESSYDSDWGGSRRSTLPCHLEAKGRGKCDRKDCDFSHRPALLKRYRKEQKHGSGSSGQSKKKKGRGKKK